MQFFLTLGLVLIFSVGLVWESYLQAEGEKVRKEMAQLTQERDEALAEAAANRQALIELQASLDKPHHTR